MAKWGEIKCPRCEELEAKHQEAFQMYVDANEARIDAEAKLAKAVDFIEDLKGCQWPFDVQAESVLAELKGQDDE